MEINPQILLEYFQSKRVPDEGGVYHYTGVVFKVRDFYVMEVKMPDGNNVGIGITMDSTAICLYEVGDRRLKKEERFKPCAYFKICDNGILFVT